MNCYLTAILVFGVFMFFRKTNGHDYCKDGNNTIRSCDGTHKSGHYIYVNLNLNGPCVCTVNPLLTGKILVTVFKYASYQCRTEVTVSSGMTTAVFTCASQYPSAIAFDVNTNETVVNIQTYYTASHSSGNSSFCLGINQNSGLNGIVSVTCGNSTTTKTTKSTTPTTSTAARTTTTTTTTTAATISPSKPETTTTTIAAMTSPSTPETTTTTIAATTSPSKPETTTTTTAATTTPSKLETSLTTTTYKTTTVVYPSPQKSTYASSDNVTYIIAGAAAGALVLVVIVIMLVAIIVLRKKTGRKGEASEHTNRAFDENSGLPDNPLYHSAHPMDEVGYSSVQKNHLGLPPTEATIKKNKDPNYDIPRNNKPINDSDTSPMAIYAVPNKSGASPPDENEPQAMYAQVLKPGKSTTQSPMQSTNQGGLVYLEVEKDATSVNENISYNQNENKNGVSYAEIKRN